MTTTNSAQAVSRDQDGDVDNNNDPTALQQVRGTALDEFGQLTVEVTIWRT